MGVLDDVIILEFADLGPIPWFDWLLADMGADITRIYHLNVAADPDSKAMNRGRVSLELDLKSVSGREMSKKARASSISGVLRRWE